MANPTVYLNSVVAVFLFCCDLKHLFFVTFLLCSVRYIEGTVKQLLEDKSGTVVGVEYRDKATENVQVQNSL